MSPNFLSEIVRTSQWEKSEYLQKSIHLQVSLSNSTGRNLRGISTDVTKFEEKNKAYVFLIQQ